MKNKIWYFYHKNSNGYLIAYGTTAKEAFDNFIKSRTNKSSSDYCSWVVDNKDLRDFSQWEYEEFTPDTYHGCLYFI